jgi:hypothetical protein
MPQRSALQLGEHVESVPRLGELIYTVHAMTRGSDEVVATRPDRSVCAEIEIDVVIAVHPATLADELASLLLLLDGDFGDAFIHFAQDELVVAGLSRVRSIAAFDAHNGCVQGCRRLKGAVL